MQSPRDVERLRTRLLVASPVLEGEVNMADIVLLESLALKCPKVLEWIQQNVDAVVSAGLGRYDENLTLRGQLGDPMADVELDADKRREHKKKRSFEWTTLLAGDPRSNLPARQAMAFLFDRCRSEWASSPTRSDFRRVQEYRYLYRWRCYHDHHERWPVVELDQFLMRPEGILQAGLHQEASSFQELCQQICDVGMASLGPANAQSLVQVFEQAEKVLGPDVLIDWGNGFGPLNALIVGIRLDQPPNRQQAVDRLLDHASVWLSGRIILQAWQDIEKPRGEEKMPADRYLLPDRGALNRAITRWFQVADSTLVSSTWSGHSPDLCPYRLVQWMSLLGRDLRSVRQVGERFIANDPAQLSVFFGSVVDDPEFDSLSLEVHWSLLPALTHLLHLAEQSDTFCANHSRFVELLRPRAERMALLSRLADSLRLVSNGRQ